PLRGSAPSAFSEPALAHVRQLVGVERRPPGKVHPGQDVATQEEASARGDAERIATVPRIVGLVSRDLDEPVDERRLVDVDVGLNVRWERQIEPVAHQPGDRVDELAVTRARAERRHRWSIKSDLVLSVLSDNGRAGRHPHRWKAPNDPPTAAY